MPNFRDTAPSITKTQNIDASTADGQRKMFRSGAGEIMLSVREPAVIPDLTGQFILAFHAAELALKAYLAKHGVLKDELQKEYGHDLNKLYVAAKSKGLVLSTPNDDEYVDWMNEFHKDGSIRYVFAEDRKLPFCANLVPVIDEIMKASA
jgi:hypothetical protein